MVEPTAILMSLRARHATDILSGTKTVEFRRKRPRVAHQTPVWIYAKQPVGAVVGFVTIAEIVTRRPNTIWRRFGRQGAISRREFLEYFDGSDWAHALLLHQPVALPEEITLCALRKMDLGFHPPQFFARVADGLHSSLQEWKRGA